jgi:hypothetical protein
VAAAIIKSSSHPNALALRTQTFDTQPHEMLIAAGSPRQLLTEVNTVIMSLSEQCPIYGVSICIDKDTDFLAPFLGFGGVAAAVWPYYKRS